MPHPPLSLVILLTQFRGVEFLPRRQGANGPKKFKRFHGEPIRGEISVACESEMVRKFSRTVMEEALAEQLKNQELSILENKSQKGGCYYTAIPRVVKQKCLCGEDLTRLNLDKIQLLESILMKEYGGDEDALLAELQFAFIAFLMGKSIVAFLPWKYILSLLFGCTESPLH